MFRLLLKHEGSRRYSVPVRNIPDPQAYQIAGAQFAINTEVKKRQLPSPVGKLQPHPDGPNVPQFEGGLLADKLAFVPRFVVWSLA